MSIQFTPSQLRVIALALQTYDRMSTDAGFEQSSFMELHELHGHYPLYLAYRSSGHNDAAEKLASLLCNDVVLIVRAYNRFFKEFDYYSEGRCKMAVVRQYHRLLIGTLAPFKLQ